MMCNARGVNTMYMGHESAERKVRMRVNRILVKMENQNKKGNIGCPHISRNRSDVVHL